MFPRIYSGRGGLAASVGPMLLVAFATFYSIVYAQTQAVSASLGGVVQDRSGAAIPGAKVTLASPEKGVTRSFTTDAEGRFSFALLPPSAYTLVVEASGFKLYKQPGIGLVAGQDAQQPVQLEVGSVQEQITVTGESPLLTTDNSNVSSDINEQQLDQLPTDLRNVFGRVLLNSSVSNSVQFQFLNGGGQVGTADQDISFLNFGGGYFGTSAYLLDGHWDTSADWGGVIYVPSIEAVQEAKIQTNSFSTQYGWSTGNVYNVITKSGSSSFHGDAFEYLRNSDLDANFFFNNANGIPRTVFRRNQFGVTAGGPVYIPGIYKQRNKTFFFAYYEGLRLGTPAPATYTVPTAAEKSGDFSALSTTLYNPFSTVQTATGFSRMPFPGNQIPASLMSNVAQALLKFWPSATSGGLSNNFAGSGSAAATSDEYGIRLDHNFTDNLRFFARWLSKRESKQGTPDYYGSSDVGGPGLTQPNNRIDGAAGLTWVLNPTTVFSFNAGYNHWLEGNVVQGYPFDMTSIGLPAFINQTSDQFPVVNVSGYAALGPQNGSGTGGFPRNNLTYSGDLSKVIGSHALTAGFTAVVLQSGGGRIYPTTFSFAPNSTAGPDPSSANASTGDAFASFLLGVGAGGSTGVSVLPFNSKHWYGLYLQDDWKATRKLTVTAGLRWEYQGAPTERFNEQSFFDFNAVNPISQQVGQTVHGEVVFNGVGTRRGLYNPSLTDFAPRLGLAYQASSKIVIRSGFGLFYVPSYLAGGSTQGYGQSTPWVAVTSNGYTPQQTLDNAFPNGVLPQTGSSLGPLTNVGYATSATQPNRPDPYMEQWMVGLQYTLTRNDLIDVSYVGLHGIKLPQSGLDYDQLPTQDLALGNQLLQQVANPFYGKITGSGCGLSSPTIAYGQLLRPFPEFCDVNVSQPLGSFSHYSALEVNYTHRWSAGLSILASYTYSHFVDNTGGVEVWASLGGVPIRNNYNLAAEKSVDGTDIPNSLVVSYIYELPVGKGKKVGANFNGAENAILGGWQVTGVTTLKQGFPIPITDATNNTNSFGGSQRPNLVGNPVLSNPTIGEWFNTAAFAQPAAFTFGNAPRYIGGLRAPGMQVFDIGIQKWFRYRELIKAQFRCEMFNAFNRVNFYAPDGGLTDGNFGRISATLPPRDIQVALKIYW